MALLLPTNELETEDNIPAPRYPAVPPPRLEGALEYQFAHCRESSKQHKTDSKSEVPFGCVWFPSPGNEQNSI